MSRIETLMYLGLGFTLALLVALVVGRFAWVTSQSFAARRRKQMTPSQVLELQTDRDRLRAEYAMMSRKLELRLDDLKARLVEQMAEVSRNRNRIQKLAADLDDRTAALSERTAEAEALKSQKQSLEDDLLARAGDLQSATAKLAETETALGAARAALAERETEIADLRADLAGFPPAAPELADLPAEERLKRRIANLSALSDEIATERRKLADERNAVAELPLAAATGAGLASRLDAAERDADLLQDELRKLDEVWKRHTIASGDQVREEPVEEDIEPARQAGRGGLANVISLAQRIRALKTDLG